MSYAQPTYAAYASGDPTDVSGKRLGAWVIDAIIYLVISNVLGFVFGAAEFKSYDLAGMGPDASSTFCDAWNATNNGACFVSGDSATTITNSSASLVIFLGLFVVFCVVQGALGGSLGKLALGLRIVHKDGRQAGIGASFIRTVLWIVDVLPCIPLVGLITMFTTKGHRRVGDMAAGTYVVDASRVGQPVILPGEPGYGYVPPGTIPGYGTPPPGVAGGTYIPGAGNDPFSQQPGAAPFGQQPGATAPSTGAQAGSSDYVADTPSWDAARNTYIKYDSSRQAWLELDQATQDWKPIST